ncbi:MAG: hypothetical protein II586_04015, partial [Butyrivibrio sp.]|nr:hypothetical protein [Butyrivibrio sp.]
MKGNIFMKAQNWSQMWLGYHPISKDSKNWKVICNDFSKEDRVVNSAIGEFAKGIEGYFGAGITEDDGDVYALEIVKDISIADEGYSIKGEKSRVTLRASDENGV